MFFAILFLVFAWIYHNLRKYGEYDKFIMFLSRLTTGATFVLAVSTILF